MIMMTIITKMQPLDPVHAFANHCNAAVKTKNGLEPRAGQIDATRFPGHGERSFTADVPQTTSNSASQDPTGPGGRFSRIRTGAKSLTISFIKMVQFGPFRAPTSPRPIWAVFGPRPNGALGVTRDQTKNGDSQ